MPCWSPPRLSGRAYLHHLVSSSCCRLDAQAPTQWFIPEGRSELSTALRRSGKVKEASEEGARESGAEVKGNRKLLCGLALRCTGEEPQPCLGLMVFWKLYN